MKIGIVVEGGIGKHILFSATLKKLKEKYGQIILVSAHPDVFIGNPNVWRNLSFSHPYLYEDYLKDVVVIKKEPYLESSYRLEKEHLLKTYCNLLGIEYDEKMIPEIYTYQFEEQQCLQTISQINKPFILLQIYGGQSTMGVNKVSYARDLPVEIAQEFVNKFKKKYPNFEILHVKLPNEPNLLNVVPISGVTFRTVFPFMKYCKTFVAIDSFLQHLSAAFQKPGVVLWGGTNPQKLGWRHNKNIFIENSCSELFCHRPETYFFDQTSAGYPWICPNNYSCMRFDPEYILENISELLDNGPNYNTDPKL